MPRPARHAVSPSAPVSSRSRPNSNRPASTPPPSGRRWRRAEADQKTAASAETAAREAWRATQREADAARERHAATEREINRHAARRSALTEARSRLTADRARDRGRACRSHRVARRIAASLETETKLAAVRSEIDAHRRLAAQVRAEAQALAREAELADRRVQAISAERGEWQNRKQGAASQIATIESPRHRGHHRARRARNAPAVFAEKRNALISEIEHAEKRAPARQPTRSPPPKP